MTFKSKIQPICRYCAKPIRKHTEDLYVYVEPPRTEMPVLRYGDRKLGEDTFKRYPTGEVQKIHVPKHVIGAPASKAEAQKLTNMKIVSVQRSLDETVITRVSVWDGESYVDEHFCTAKCAQNFGYSAAISSPNLTTGAYRDALKARNTK